MAVGSALRDTFFKLPEFLLLKAKIRFECVSVGGSHTRLSPRRPEFEPLF